MIDALAIDCCWLVHLDGDTQDFEETIRVMAKLHESRTLMLFDSEGGIRREYEEHVTGPLGRKFLQCCLVRGTVAYYSGHMTANHKSALDKISFDPSDRKYLAVSIVHRDAAYLTSEEKHLEPTQVASIKAATGVTVLDTSGLDQLI